MLDDITAQNANETKSKIITEAYKPVKRLLDIIISSAAILLLSPLMLVSALIIKLSSPSEHVLFKQQRVGRYAKLFTVYKFRSMSSKAPSDVATCELENAESYITPFGGFMRKTSIDELPQLFNVLKGDMSIVGPRPLVYTETKIHDLREKSGVYKVRPGITGLAQISGRDNLDIYQKVIYDTCYVSKMSLGFDLLMLIGSVVTVASGAGIVEGKQENDSGAANPADGDKLYKNPHVNRILMAGNSEIMIFGMRKEIVKELVSRGYEVYTSFPKSEFGDGKETAEKFGCKFIETPISGHGKNPFQDLGLYFRYKKILRQVKPEIVLTYTIKPNVYLGYACKRKGIPYVVNITGLGLAVEEQGKLQKLTLLMYKIAMKKAKRVFFQNTENMKFFLDNNVANKVAVLLPGSGVNLERFSPLVYPDGKEVHFLFISRIMKNKGIEQYFEAAEYIKQKHPETVFHILGTLSENEYEPRLRELCEKGVIIYHGLQDRVEDFHAISSCTIHPTFYPEGMSNVLLETAACARPAITTDRSGCREIVEDGVNGFICRQRDAVSLEEQIERFLALTIEQRREMGLRGREKVEKQFDRKIVIRRYLDEIESIR